MRNGLWQHRSLRTIILAATPLLCLSVPAGGQNAPAQDNRNSTAQDNRAAQFDLITRRDLAEFDRFLDSHPQIADQVRSKPWLVTNQDFLHAHPDLQGYLQAHPQLADAISRNPREFVDQDERFHRPGYRQHLAEFDQFLDTHPKIEQELRDRPWLATNHDYLQGHQDLRAYLQAHPALSQTIGQNPAAFIQDEEAWDRTGNTYAQNGVNRDDLVLFGHFLDSHPEIAEQVRKDPSLVDNQRFVHDHPALQTFLADHAQLRATITANPRAFMQDEDALQNGRYADRNAYASNRDDVTRRDVAQFSQFLDRHREIAEQVDRNPSLLDNRQFVENHPPLQTYFQNNPGVRQEVQQNPNAFMQAENRYAGENGGFDRDHLTSFGTFMSQHSDIARDVAERPDCVNDQKYLQDHPQLAEYLNSNPGVRQDLAANPDNFVKSAGVTGSGTVGTSTSGSGNGVSVGTSGTATGTAQSKTNK
jgi:hypothetical protein